MHKYIYIYILCEHELRDFYCTRGLSIQVVGINPIVFEIMFKILGGCDHIYIYICIYMYMFEFYSIPMCEQCCAWVYD